MALRPSAPVIASTASTASSGADPSAPSAPPTTTTTAAGSTQLPPQTQAQVQTPIQPSWAQTPGSAAESPWGDQSPAQLDSLWDRGQSQEPSHDQSLQTSQPQQQQLRYAKSPRILACQLCQGRKIKCNRVFPCDNCKRVGCPRIIQQMTFHNHANLTSQSNVQCVPSKPAPLRKRRPPHQALQEKLAAVTEKMEQMRREMDAAKASGQGIAVPVTTPTQTTTAAWNSKGNPTLIQEEGGVRYTESTLRTVYQEVCHHLFTSWSSR